jgi:hypothetical protein
MRFILMQFLSFKVSNSNPNNYMLIWCHVLGIMEKSFFEIINSSWDYNIVIELLLRSPSIHSVPTLTPQTSREQGGHSFSRSWKTLPPNLNTYENSLWVAAIKLHHWACNSLVCMPPQYHCNCRSFSCTAAARLSGWRELQVACYHVNWEYSTTYFGNYECADYGPHFRIQNFSDWYPESRLPVVDDRFLCPNCSNSRTRHQIRCCTHKDSQGLHWGKIPNTVGIRWFLYSVLLDDIHRNTIMEVWHG